MKEALIFFVLGLVCLGYARGELPSKYDSRELGYITSVKDQGSSNLCWAYSSISSSEASILKYQIDDKVTNKTLNLNAISLGYRRHNRDPDPLNNVRGEQTNQNYYTTSGDPSYSTIVLSQWCGPISGTESAKNEPYLNALYRLENGVFIDGSGLSKEDRIKQIKRAILNYGAVTFSYNNLRETEYYNPRRETSSNYYGHACTLVGWDDSIPASKFFPSGTQVNGGWIVKNSYNSLKYFYLSYETTSSYTYAFDYGAKDKYDFNYFYDGVNGDSLSYEYGVTEGANVFLAKKGEGKVEYVRAVSIGLNGKKIHAEVFVYTDLEDKSNPESGKLEGRGSGYFEFPGFRTVLLDTPVKVTKGQYFSVVVKVSGSSTMVRTSMEECRGKSFKKTSSGWSSYGAYSASPCLRIKAFTKLMDESEKFAERESIEGGKVSELKDYTYTGGEIIPMISLTKDGKVLMEERDYTLEYKDNVNIGKAAINIRGKNNYKGEIQVEFNIRKNSLLGCSVETDIRESIYTGYAITKLVDVTCGGVSIVRGKDYSVTFENNVNAGDHAKVKIEGINNYEGTLEKEFKINTRQISSCDILLDSNEVYAPTFEAKLSVIYSGVTLKKDVDYKVSYQKAEDGSKSMKLLIEGIGNFSGKAERDLVIIGKTIEGSEIVLQEEEFVFDGEEKTPAVTVKIDGEALVQGVDYQLSYSNNVAATSSAKVTVEGIGDYSRSAEKYFTIKPKDINSIGIVFKNSAFTYNAKAQELEYSIQFQGKDLAKGTDYTATYSNNVNASKEAKVILKGIGNYSGVKEQQYEIKTKNINLCQISLDEKDLFYNGEEQEKDFTIRCDGKVLKKNTDYTVSYSDNQFPTEKAKMKISGIGNFSETYEHLFSILKAKRPLLDTEEKISVPKDAKKLSDIQLPKGWGWKEPEKEITDDLVDAAAYYTGDDQEYFEETSFTFKIRAESQVTKPDSSTTESGSSSTTNKSGSSKHIRIKGLLLSVIFVLLI